MSRTEVEPIPVQVINHPEPKRYEKRAAYRTFVLTAAQPFVNVAGYDPLRICIRLTGHTNSFVIAGSVSQASDPNNAVPNPPAPNGRLIPANAINVEFVTEGQNEIWFAGNTFPTVIGCEIIRKVPE